MPEYPRRASEYHALLQEGDGEQAELDCGCLMREHENGESIALWLCTLHEAAQQLLDALDAVTKAAFRAFGVDALIGTVGRCVFCEGTWVPGGVQEHFGEDCPMVLVHQVIRRAKGGDAQQAG